VLITVSSVTTQVSEAVVFVFESVGCSAYNDSDKMPDGQSECRVRPGFRAGEATATEGVLRPPARCGPWDSPLAFGEFDPETAALTKL